MSKRSSKTQKSIIGLFNKPAKISKPTSPVIEKDDEPALPVEVFDSNESCVVSDDVKLPKESTIAKWKREFEWLEITDRKTMICKICVSQKDKIVLKNPKSSMAFINGSENFKSSAVKEHSLSVGHRTGVDEANHEEAVAVGISLPPKKVVHNVPDDSAISSAMKIMGEKERSGVQKLVEIAFLIALKGRPFTDFKDLIELEKLHGVKFDTSAYENEPGCREFINSIANYFFDIDVRDKLKRVNFIAILIDGSTDRAVKEQEVLYVMYVDPDTHKPTLSYFEVIEMSEFDQSSTGLLQSIKSAFERHELTELWDKLIYLSADGASVNSGKDSGLIAKLQEEHEWVLFVWCFSHRLELALRDALKDFTSPVDESLMNLYYLYHKSPKKLRELHHLYDDIKEDFEMFGNGVKPLKATGTRWIDHRIRAMGRLVDKFGLYTRHLKNFSKEAKDSKVKATVKGKLDKILDSQILLRSALLIDLLAPAKIFSLITQKQDPNIMETIEGLEKTRRNYTKLLRKFKRDNNHVLELPTLKAVIDEIEGNGEWEGNPMYQGQRLKYYGRGKQYVVDNCIYLVESIINCYDERYCFDENTNDADGTTNDHLIFHICKVLNASTWPKLSNNDSDDDETILRTQLQSLSRVYNQFSAMDVFKSVDEESVIDGYVEIVRFCQRYFDYENVDQIELWHKVLLQNKDNAEWYGIRLVIEICLCTPCSNATLERFFNHLKIVKTDQRTALSSSSLNSILRIKLRDNNTLNTFHEEFSDGIVSYWYNEKNRRPKQKPRKKYKKRESSVKSREKFDLDEFTLDSSESDSDSVSNSEYSVSSEDDV